jgi:hypothetical protein
VILVAESADDREKLFNLVESIPEIVIGESRCERTGQTRVVELGKPRTNTQQLDDRQMSVEGPDEQIDVWSISPHLNMDYDMAVFDDRDRAIEYANEVIESVFENLGDNETVEVTIKHAVMPRREYEKWLTD